MRNRWSRTTILASVILVCLAGPNLYGDEQKEEPKKSGAVVGVVAAKGTDWVEVKADGEQKARRYVPNWVGGAPREGGGPDKEMIKVLKGLTVGSRVRLEWKFEERPRVVKVEVLKAAEAKGKAEKDEKHEVTKKGTVTGKLVAKEPNWIEVLADGEKKARRYFFHQGGTKELHGAIDKTALGSRVRIEWIFVERPRVMKLELIKKAD
jgi:hypothetical protein